jgi:hypothetical protein
LLREHAPDERKPLGRPERTKIRTIEGIVIVVQADEARPECGFALVAFDGAATSLRRIAARRMPSNGNDSGPARRRTPGFGPICR